MAVDAAPWRLFVALELPEEVRGELGELIQRLRGRIPRDVRWVPAENLHLTLKFLGACPPDRAGAIAGRLAGLVPGLLPIELATGSLGVFPGWAAPRVVWVGLGGDVGRLERLQRAIETGLAGLGFPTEQRAFRPHLTLGRVRDTATPESRRQIGDQVRRSGTIEVRPFTATTVHLMRGQLSSQGSRYEPVSTWTSAFLAPP